MKTIAQAFREDLAPMIYWDDEYDDMKVTDDITL